MLRLVAQGLTNAEVAKELFIRLPHRKPAPKLRLSEAGSKLARGGHAFRLRAQPPLILSLS